MNLHYNVDDSKILGERLDEIEEKLPDIDELHFDGGYGSSPCVII